MLPLVNMRPTSSSSCPTCVASAFLLHAGDDHLTNAVLQGKYDGMTFWEQLDDGVQNTNNRKFLTLVPVVLFLLATHGTDYR